MIYPQVAKRIARESKAKAVDRVASYLVHCFNNSDCQRSLEQLRQNAPYLFKAHQ
jgi:hypothetical protein